MIVKIECPSCQTEGNMSLADVKYVGPYKCWKCKDLFSIEIQEDRLISCEPLTEEEFDRLQEELREDHEEQKRRQELEDFKNKFRRD